MYNFHTDIYSKQSPKLQENPCGDVVNSYTDEKATTLVLSDGLGTGPNAHNAATLCVSEILNLVRSGVDIHQVFDTMVEKMNKAWGTNSSFAVFVIVQVLTSGETTILGYEMPQAILVSGKKASAIEAKTWKKDKAELWQSNLLLENKDSILLVSDGITQSTLKFPGNREWSSEKISEFLSEQDININYHSHEIVESLHSEARLYWGSAKGDDCSVVLAKCRRAITVNLLTGPPIDTALDKKIVDDFMSSRGIKIVCGGSTAKMLSREAKLLLEVNESKNPIIPPSYKIKGITLVSEGVVTLNQVYSTLMEEFSQPELETVLFELSEFLTVADKVVIYNGKAKNPIADEFFALHKDLKPRGEILNLLIKKLKEMNKLVILKEY